MLKGGRNYFDCKRLDALNIQKYILSKDLRYNKINLKEMRIISATPYLQKDFGEPNDCSLTSLLVCLAHWLKKTRTPQEIYTEIEKNARRYLYRGNLYGTIPFFIKKIYQECVNNFRLDFKIDEHYVRGIGFNTDFVKTIIDHETPIVLSMLNDGRDYYMNHTVTIIGYQTFLLEGEKLKDKLKTVFCVYDNWNATISYIDLDIISRISSICY